MRVLQGCFIIFIVVVVVGQRGGKKNELQSFLGLIEGCDILTDSIENPLGKHKTNSLLATRLVSFRLSE